jgi:solute carrier family 25 oxoglutarate transporter 11
LRAAASAISGISASVASLPLDNAKTKLQKMTKGPDGTLPYKNIFDAMGKVFIH